MRHVKVFIISATVGFAVVFAGVRVWPYVTDARAPSADSPQKQIARVVVNPVVPEYEVKLSEEEAARLGDHIRAKVRAVVGQLPPVQRPSDAEAAALASAYAGRLLLHRTGTREEYLGRIWYKPNSLLVNDDVGDKANEYWLHNTAWARHGEIDVDSIQVFPRLIRGTRVNEEPSMGGTSYHRNLADGSIWTDATGSYSVYEIVLSTTVPSFDGKEEFETRVSTAMINDGPERQWGAVSVTLTGIPTGKFAFTPRP